VRFAINSTTQSSRGANIVTLNSPSYFNRTFRENETFREKMKLSKT
jgi:hypothetical protein